MVIEGCAERITDEIRLSSDTAGSGVTCGGPPARTVEIQNNSASSITRRVSAHGVATAPGH